MEVLITILEFLAVLVVVVVVHEFGHFATAKAMGIRVNEFGFGFPPRLFGFRKGETVYTVNLLPLGGFVKLEGENDPSDPRSFAGKGVGTRSIVLVAGVVMNLILAVVLLTAFYMFTATEEAAELEVGEVSAGSPAELAGMVRGDVILAVNRTPVTGFDDLLENQINPNRGKEIELLIQRDDTQHTLRLVPRVNPPEGEGPIGVGREFPSVRAEWFSRPPWEAAPMGLRFIKFVLLATKDEVTGSISDRRAPEFLGPIGGADFTGRVAREMGLIFLIPLAALISIGLGIFNILPIPPLDGGRLVFVIIEWVRRGKRIPPEKEGFVQFVGFVAIIIPVAVAIGYNDIVRIVEGNNFLR